MPALQERPPLHVWNEDIILAQRSKKKKKKSKCSTHLDPFGMQDCYTENRWLKDRENFRKQAYEIYRDRNA